MGTLSHLSKIFLEMEAEIGTRDLSREVLNALELAVDDICLDDDREFFKQFNDLLSSIKNTQPRIGLVIDDFYQIWKALEDEMIKNKALCGSHDHYLELKKIIKKKIRAIRKNNKHNSKEISKQGKSLIRKGETILIHSLSHTVLDTLKKAIKTTSFKVVVSEQEYGKTQEIIQFLHTHHIPFSVVPQYMLSHIVDDIDKIFLGALTLNSFGYVVGDGGTNNVVSTFHNKKPIYLFMGTRKCSFWDAQKRHHSYKEKQVRSHIYKTFRYARIKFSHDRVPLNRYDYVVTEKRVFSSPEMIKWYELEFEKRKEWRNMFIKD